MKQTICKGFKASGLASGIKKNGDKDLGIIYSEIPANAAGVFTKNCFFFKTSNMNIYSSGS